MGKYMRKGKGIGNVALMEVSQGPLGLRTRARAQASSYLELRSRRLQKNWCLPKIEPSEMQSSEAVSHMGSSAASHGGCWQNFQCRKDPCHSHSAPVDSPSTSSFQNDTGAAQEEPNFTIAPLSRSNSFSLSQGRPRGILTQNQRTQQKRMLVNYDQSNVDGMLPRAETANSGDSSRSMEAEASFGENPMDHEELPATDRPIREGTPTSYACDIEAPGSVTRPSCGRRGQGTTASLQSAYMFVDADVDDFFKDAEQQEQRRFMERYNFDPVNDRPMPGRYEWVSM